MPHQEQLTQIPLFTAGQHGYHTYRIPALAVTNAGTVLAFCEGRMYGRGDAGKIEIVLRRSHDGGRTWEQAQCVVADGDMTCGNPCPVLDRHSGTVWLPFCKNPGEGHKADIIEGKAARTVWVTHSNDDGRTWSAPVEITAFVKLPDWTWYATGPGHGIHLASGRLLVPCDHVLGGAFGQDGPGYSHVILSDNGGATWRIGGIAGPGTSECEAVELTGGTIYLNARNCVGTGRRHRAVALSRNGGETFGPLHWDDALIDPICQASLVRVDSATKQIGDHVLFANPASTSRERLTVCLSEDGGCTWPVQRVLHAGPAAYSDLAIVPDAMVLCLYERGDEHPYETLTLARFPLAWLTDGPDG